MTTATKTKKSIATLTGAICAVALLISVAAEAQNSSLVVKNESSWKILQIFLTTPNTDDWGPDRLGADVIEPGRTYILVGIRCGIYYVKLVDEDGDECLNYMDFCGGKTILTITNDYLLTCEKGIQVE